MGAVLAGLYDRFRKIQAVHEAKEAGSANEIRDLLAIRNDWYWKRLGAEASRFGAPRARRALVEIASCERRVRLEGGDLKESLESVIMTLAQPQKSGVRGARR